MTEKLLWTEVVTSVEHCETAHTDAQRLGNRLFWIAGQDAGTRELIADQLAEAEMVNARLMSIDTALAPLTSWASLIAADGLPVALDQLPELPPGSKSIGTVDVDSAPTDTAVQAAVTQGTETSNQNVWAIAGLLAGGFLLGWAFKMVRP